MHRQRRTIRRQCARRQHRHQINGRQISMNLLTLAFRSPSHVIGVCACILCVAGLEVACSRNISHRPGNCVFSIQNCVLYDVHIFGIRPVCESSAGKLCWLLQFSRSSATHMCMPTHAYRPSYMIRKLLVWKQTHTNTHIPIHSVVDVLLMTLVMTALLAPLTCDVRHLRTYSVCYSFICQLAG